MAVNYTKSFNLTKQCILESHLFGNSEIQFKHKPLFLKQWCKSGITEVEHVWEKTDNKIISSGTNSSIGKTGYQNSQILKHQFLLSGYVFYVMTMKKMKMTLK